MSTENLPPHRRARREQPLDFFRQFLRAIWMDNTEEEAEEQWRQKVTFFSDYADDALFCLDWVVANPPDNLPDILVDDGWIALYRESDDPQAEIEDFTFDETVEWLRDMTDHFKEIYEEGKASSRSG